MEYVELLDAIYKSRLLFPTGDQLASHIGYKRFLEKGMKTQFKTAFMQRAVYQAMFDEMASRSNGRINLTAIIEEYKTASAFLNKRMKTNYSIIKQNKNNKKDEEKINKKNNERKRHIFEMLEYIYVLHFIPENIKGKTRKVLSDIYDEEEDILKIDATILFLMLIGSLPTYNSKHDATNIERDFKSAIDILKKWKWSEFAPLDKYENFLFKAVRQDKKCQADSEKWESPKNERTVFIDIPLLNRVTLIAMIQEYLYYVDTIVHEDETKRFVAQRQQTQRFPNIEGLWSRDKTGKTPPYYHIINVNDAYFLFDVKQVNGELVRKRFELGLFVEAGFLPDIMLPECIKAKTDDNIEYYHGRIISNDYTKDICEWHNDEDAINMNKLMKYVNDYFCEVHLKDNKPQKLVLKLIDNNGQHENQEWYYIAEEKIESGKYKNITECREIGFKYVFRDSIAAVSYDFIYVGVPFDEEAWNKNFVDTYKAYYKIPKKLDDCFNHVELGDSFGIIISEENDNTRIFVGSSTFEAYYEVTTEEHRERYGIELLETLPL